MDNVLAPPVSQPITPQQPHALEKVSFAPADAASLKVDAGFYGRFSSDLQRDTSIVDQLQQCRAIADGRNDRIPDRLIFSDEGISGTSAHNRPGLQKLLSICKQQPVPFTTLYIPDTSRLARNLEELLHICKILKFYGVTLHIVSTGLRSDSPGFEMCLAFVGWMDEEFVRGIKDKSRRGAIGSIDRGYTPGGSCYGYRNVPVEDPNKRGIHGHNFVIGVYQEIIPEQAEVIRRIFQWYADGWSYARIATQLNADGVLSPQPSRNGCIRSWGHTGIREMLLNERYRGKVIFGRTTRVKDPETHQTIVRKTLEATWIIRNNESLRIVSEELWAAVRAQNQQKSRNPCAARAGGMSRTAASRAYLFSGRLQCGLCRANMVIVGNTWGYPAYGCPYHRFRGVCTNSVTIQQPRLERQLLARIAASLRKPEYPAFIAEEFEKQLAEAQRAEALADAEVLESREALLKERSVLIESADNLGKSMAAHGFSPTLSSQLSHAEKRIETITGLLKPKVKIEVKLPSAAQIEEFLHRRMEELVELLIGDPIRAKHELAKRIDKLVLTPATQDGRPVLLVTGDLKLFAEDDVMPFISGEGIVGHYTFAKVTLDGFALDPKLAKAA
jgi:DNA invertase Pin-like site-specific DNA recombinase